MRLSLAAIMVACILMSPVAAAQQSYKLPRAPDGHPELGGVWTNANVDAAFDPPEDELPFRDRSTAMVWREKYATYMTGAPMEEFTHGVDTLPNRDRCLMAANAAAPPMTSQGYNDAYQIVQTPSVIVISVEMMRETRIIPIVADAAAAKSRHGPQVLQRWAGDSVGWWEGDTLVVETINVNVRQARQSPYPTSPDAIWIERFTRTARNQLAYHVEIIDPEIYTRTWTVDYTFRPANRLWEYACHEGNYGMEHILTGARKVERDAARN
jgi:hypothetical protein